MIKDYSEGGLRMIDLTSFNKALKSTWVKKYVDPENDGSENIYFIGNCTDTAAGPFLEATWTGRIFPNT